MSICKIFDDHTSFFSKIIETRNSQNTLTLDLKSIENWTYLWKIQFNTDLRKQGKEVLFSQKLNT